MSPKQSFLTNKDRAKNHQLLLEPQALLENAYIALAELACRSEGPFAGAEIAGARKFIEIFFSLGKQTVAPTPLKPENLDPSDAIQPAFPKRTDLGRAGSPGR